MCEIHFIVFLYGQKGFILSRLKFPTKDPILHPSPDPLTAEAVMAMMLVFQWELLHLPNGSVRV